MEEGRILSLSNFIDFYSLFIWSIINYLFLIHHISLLVEKESKFVTRQNHEQILPLKNIYTVIVI